RLLRCPIWMSAVRTRPSRATNTPVAAGILTTVGGRTAHAAVVARQLGKVCLVGCRSLVVDEQRREATIGTTRLSQGDWPALDGDRGEVTLGARAIAVERPAELAEIARWRAQAARAQG